MKTCFKCGTEKPLSEFYKHSKMADGHLNKCKSCTKSDVTAHRAANLDRIQEYDRQRGMLPHRVAARQEYQQTEAGKSAVLRSHQRSKKRHPDRYKARNAVNSAIANGRLVPWPACAFVPCTDPKVEAHHPDYSRPLDVVWLCPTHHKQAHALFTSLIR